LDLDAEKIGAVLGEVTLKLPDCVVLRSRVVKAKTTSLKFGAPLAVTYFATEKMEAARRRRGLVEEIAAGTAEGGG